jgi:drug/metabolite transporter (DMT)-like permease
VSRLGYLFVILASALFATNGVVSRVAIDGGLAPSELAAWRVYGAALLLLGFLIAAVRRLRRDALLPLALFGVFGIVLSQGLYYEAIALIDIAIVLVIVYTAPIPVAIYQRIRFREQLPNRAYVAMVIAIGGVVFAIFGGGGGIGSMSTVGLLFAVGTMVAYAAQVILAARQPVSLPPLARTGAAMLVAAVVWMVIVPVWTLPFDLVGESEVLTGRVDITVPIGAAVAYVIVLGTALPYVLLVVGARRIGPGAASMVGMTEPVVASILAWFVLAQALSLVQATGIAVTVLAIGFVERTRQTAITTRPGQAG